MVASTPLTVCFALLSILVAGALVWGFSAAAPEERSATWRWRASVGLGAWLGGGSALALGGALDFGDAMPPPIMPLVGAGMVLTLGVVLGPVGRRLSRLPTTWLVGIQVMRIPIEAMLHAASTEGLIPERMTYLGWNFDVATGVAALGLLVALRRGEVPRSVLHVFNAAGFVLLVVIVTTAILSVPPPLGVFEPPHNVLIVSWPFVWLPTLLVPTALAGHLLLWRRLRAPRR